MKQAREQLYATVSSKGQLVIPAAIRQELGIEPGTRIAIRREGPELILKPETLAAKLALIERMHGRTAGGPSGRKCSSKTDALNESGNCGKKGGKAVQ